MCIVTITEDSPKVKRTSNLVLLKWQKKSREVFRQRAEY